MEIADKIANPTKFYQHPNEIKMDTTLSTEDKIKSLENWLDDIKLKQVAEEEYMLSTQDNGKNYIKEINNLLEEYGAKEE